MHPMLKTNLAFYPVITSQMSCNRQSELIISAGERNSLWEMKAHQPNGKLLVYQ